MQFNLESKITNHNINFGELAERVIIGPQEEVLTAIENFNQRFRSDIRCTKKFRWEPGFYKKLKALQLNVMGFGKDSRTVKTSFNKVVNSNWHYRQLKQDCEKIDTMLYLLRSDNMMFQDNTEVVTEKASEWFDNIITNAEIMNNQDNLYNFEIYIGREPGINKDYIIFVITVDGYTMDVGNNTNYAPIQTGKVKMYISLDIVRILAAAISNDSINFGNQFNHSGYNVGGQYFPLERDLHFPFISGGRGWASRVLDFSNVANDYTKIPMLCEMEPHSDTNDGYTSLCFGDLKTNILRPLASGKLDETVFWLNKWGGFYNINSTGPLNNYSKMYLGSPKVLYEGAMEGILTNRSHTNCDYNLPELKDESYCERYECTMRDKCNKYEVAYAIIDDEALAMREQILVNFMISRGLPFSILEDSLIHDDYTRQSLTHVSLHWETAESYFSDMLSNIKAYFGVNIEREAMIYNMASMCQDVNFQETWDCMPDFSMDEKGFYEWLNAWFRPTILPQIIPMNNDGASLDEQFGSDLEQRLLEEYSSTGRGIPIQINRDMPF